MIYRKEHLVKHEVLHTGVKKFSCGFCSKKFPRKDALNDHMRRLHTDIINSGATASPKESKVAEYPCSLGCSDVFVSRQTLIKHLRNFHGINLDDEEQESSPFIEFNGNNGTQKNLSIYDNSDAEMPHLPLSISMNIEGE